MKIEKKTIVNDEKFLRQTSKEVDFSKDDWKEAIEVLADYCRNDDNILAIASVQMERPYKIEIEYFDENQNVHRETYEGVPATVLSHEMDHLDGILHIDKALKILKLNKEERKALREKEPYEIIRKEGSYKE